MFPKYRIGDRVIVECRDLENDNALIETLRARSSSVKKQRSMEAVYQAGATNFDLSLHSMNFQMTLLQSLR